MNWTTTIERRKALPLGPGVVRSFASLCFVQKETSKGLFILISFLGILRNREALNLRVKDFVFMRNGQVILLLHGTKISRAQGSP